LQGVAEAKKVRPVFIERKTRVEQHRDIAAMLVKPRLDFIALNVLQAWLLKKQSALVADFLNAVGIAHQNGAVDEMPKEIADDKLNAAVESLVAKYPREHVAVYLRAFNDLNDSGFPNLAALLDKDARLQLGAA
jgi:hypothetical protein